MYEYPFLDPEIELDKRIDDLLGRLSVDEKISQMVHESPGIPRLGIAPYSWWNEGLHGIGRAGSATIFPQAIGLAACFDRDRAFRVATAISDEARIKFSLFKNKGTSGRYAGLTFWTPNINIFRDPRWGRGQETYGEDPYLTGEIGTAFVGGLQGNDPNYLKTAACAKHFAVHSGPEQSRHSFDAKVSPYDLHDTYLPAFKKLVTKAHVESVMGAYNRVNGEPACGSEFLLKKMLRESWGFKGHVVSDCWALLDFHQNHKVTSTPAESAALALTNGCDLNCGSTFPYLVDSIIEGLVSEKDLDRALRRLFRTRFRLGEFDPASLNPFSSTPIENLRSKKHLELSYETAVDSMVLLKNNGILPLRLSDLKSVYLTGPNGLGPESLLGNYHGLSPRMVSFVEGMTEALGTDIKFEYRHGCLLAEEKRNPVDWASSESKSFDVIFAFVGLNILLEGEEGDAIADNEFGDRPSYSLPKGQHDYLLKLLSQDRPLVLVVSAGSAIDLTPYFEKAAAVVYTWYPGELGGSAFADLITGKRNFTGRLPISFPYSITDLPAFDDYSMEGRTYRYMRKDPFLPFGFGLSYWQPSFKSIELSVQTIKPHLNLFCKVCLQNPFDRSVECVVQLYLERNPNRSVARGQRKSVRELVGFGRVVISPNSEVIFEAEIEAEQLLTLDAEGNPFFEPGLVTLFAGNCQPGKRSAELGGKPCISTLLRMEE